MPLCEARDPVECPNPTHWKPALEVMVAKQLGWSTIQPEPNPQGSLYWLGIPPVPVDSPEALSTTSGKLQRVPKCWDDDAESWQVAAQLVAAIRARKWHLIITSVPRIPLPYGAERVEGWQVSVQLPTNQLSYPTKHGYTLPEALSRAFLLAGEWPSD